MPANKQLMKKNPLKDGALTENSAPIGTVTPAMIQERAVQLAMLSGRPAKEASSADRIEAKQQLTGESDVADQTEAILESAPESERWDPAGGSTGQKITVAPGEDEDEEGRSDNERLVEEGAAEAELDHEVQAEKEATKRNL